MIRCMILILCLGCLYSLKLQYCKHLGNKAFFLYSSKFDLNHDLSVEYQLTNIFGRFAEHKALGFTSTYSNYTPSPLSLWIPTRWSRRLRVDHPDWKKVFKTDRQLTKNEFENRIQDLPFKYPVECPLPNEIKNIIKRDSPISEGELRENITLKESIERIFTENYKTDPRVIDVVFYLFGGQPQADVLDIDIMESKILEWGRVTCADDPIIDYPAFEERIKVFLKRTDLPFLFRQ